jgi:hypothetical protein
MAVAVKPGRRPFKQAGKGGRAYIAKAVTVGKKKTSGKRRRKTGKSKPKPPSPVDGPDPRIWPLEKR